MSDPLYFLHIPKCGGTTVDAKLHGRFGERMCPALVWDNFFLHPEFREPRYDGYCGHFGNDLQPFLGRRLTTFALLRDPVARTVSHYHEIRRSRGHPLHAVVARLDLWHFLTSPLTVPIVWNLQARYLAGPSVDIDRMAGLFPPSSFYGLALGWEMNGCATNPELLWHAARNALQNLDFVGVLDDPEAMAELARRYGLSPEPLRENAGDHHGLEPPSERAVARIRALTEVDQSLVDLVRAGGSLPEPGRVAP